MLFLGIILLLLAIAWTPVRISPIAFNRLAILVLLYSSLLAFVNVSWHLGPMDLGMGIFGGFYHVTILSQSFDCFIQLLAAIILLLGASKHPFVILLQNPSTAHYLRGCVAMRHVAEYPLVILFTTLGMSSLISSSDLLSMFLSMELQTLALYILATIYRDSEAATSAGLKYLLMGALSSSLILLGSSLLYGFTGLSSFEGLYLLCSMGVAVPNSGILLALLIMGIALLFKVAAAPFHNWAPDVYDGVPTNVTTWLAIMPKLAILAFLAELQGFTHLSLPGTLDWGNILLVSALLSLLIGAVVGLAQYRMKRLLAYSSMWEMLIVLWA